jgi:hypothetical protein
MTRIASGILEARINERKGHRATARGCFPPEFNRKGRPFLKNLTGSYPGHFNPNYEAAVYRRIRRRSPDRIEKLEKIRKHTTADNVRKRAVLRA